MSNWPRLFMKRTSVFALAILVFCAVKGKASLPPEAPGVSADEEQRKNELEHRLCREPELDCGYVNSILRDPRLEIYRPPAPGQPPSQLPREIEKNPYLTKRFGLLSPDSLERCRSFISEHEQALDAAYQTYGVPEEIICGHLRIESDFGIPTKLSPNPLGKRPAVNQLVSLYVGSLSVQDQGSRTVRRREFAFVEISKLIAAGKKNGWDLFDIPGSPTGAIGLAQFEPSSFNVAVDGNGDGRIDLFDPDDAILSIAHFLVTRGWDLNPEHQRRAIYAYFGGHYNTDPNKYYMKAILRYAEEVHIYLKGHPVEHASL